MLHHGEFVQGPDNHLVSKYIQECMLYKRSKNVEPKRIRQNSNFRFFLCIKSLRV